MKFLRLLSRGVFSAAWQQFKENLWDYMHCQTQEETVRMERILDRCEAERASRRGLDPLAVDQWITHLEHYNSVIVVARRDLAVAVRQPIPHRIH
jgi:hypothetical protein